LRAALSKLSLSIPSVEGPLLWFLTAFAGVVAIYARTQLETDAAADGRGGRAAGAVERESERGRRRKLTVTRRTSSLELDEDAPALHPPSHEDNEQHVPEAPQRLRHEESARRTV